MVSPHQPRSNCRASRTTSQPLTADWPTTTGASTSTEDQEHSPTGQKAKRRGRRRGRRSSRGESHSMSSTNSSGSRGRHGLSSFPTTAAKDHGDAGSISMSPPQHELPSPPTTSLRASLDTRNDQLRSIGQSAGSTTISPSPSTPRSEFSQADDFDLPRSYNKNYPHPLSTYASPGVNSEALAMSGYAPLLEHLQLSNPRLVTGAIIADCGKADLAAPALSVAPKSGCGIPAKLWVPLSTWAGVKVPLGAVDPSRSINRFGLPAPANVPSSPGLSSSSSTVGRRGELPDTPVSPTFSIKASRPLRHRHSDMNLRQAASHFSYPPTLSETLQARRGSLPNIDVRCANEIPSQVSKTLNCLPSPDDPMIPRTAPLSRLDTLATVEETEDDTYIPPSVALKPIGAEISERGMLPLHPLDHKSRPRLGRRASEDTPSRPTAVSALLSPHRPHTALSNGSFSRPSLFEPSTPAKGYFSIESSPLHKGFFDHELSSTSLDFSAGKSIWS